MVMRQAPSVPIPKFAHLCRQRPSELRNHKGHWNHGLASVIQIEKFAPNHAANSGEFLDHHTRSFSLIAPRAMGNIVPDNCGNAENR